MKSLSDSLRRGVWLQGLMRADELGALMRQNFLRGGSEWAEWGAFEGWRTGLTGSLAAQVLIGAGVTLTPTSTAGSMRLQTPGGMAAFIEEINVKVAVTDDGESGQDVLAALLEVKRGPMNADGSFKAAGVGLKRIASVPLRRYVQGVAGLMYGAIPVRQWLGQGEDLEVSLPALECGDRVFDLSVSVMARFEPVELAVAAGVVDVGS